MQLRVVDFAEPFYDDFFCYHCAFLLLQSYSITQRFRGNPQLSLLRALLYACATTIMQTCVLGMACGGLCDAHPTLRRSAPGPLLRRPSDGAERGREEARRVARRAQA